MDDTHNINRSCIRKMHTTLATICFYFYILCIIVQIHAWMDENEMHSLFVCVYQTGILMVFCCVVVLYFINHIVETHRFLYKKKFVSPTLFLNRFSLSGSIMFHVRRRPADSQPRRRKKKPLGVQNGSNNVTVEREGPMLVEITHSGDGGRRVKLTAEPVEVGGKFRNSFLGCFIVEGWFLCL